MSFEFKIIRIREFTVNIFFVDCSPIRGKVTALFEIELSDRTEEVEAELNDQLCLVPSPYWDKEYDFLTREMKDEMEKFIEDHYQEIEKIVTQPVKLEIEVK